VALGGSRPPNAVGCGTRVHTPILGRNSAENVIIIRKKEKRGEEEKGVREEVVKVRSSAGFSSR
jgi:hypothetical protein